MKVRSLGLLGSFLVLHICVVASLESGDDPYSILGVGRTASPNDVKKAYKKLARNWHPDKNNDPSAQETFIKINQAYEILSDEEKRRDFDNYGHDAPNRERNQGSPFNNGHSGFSFFFNDNEQHSRRDFITTKAYDSNIIPISYEKPYVLEVISNWCMECMQMESMWDAITNDLKNLGVGTGVLNVNRSPRLADRLGIDGVPSIVGVINGKVTFYNGRISVQEIKEFVNGLFPAKLITRVTSKKIDTFLDTEDNKPKVILFTPKNAPSLLYNIVAFSNKERQTFGFVSMGKDDGEKLRRKYRVTANEPTLMIFKEEKAVPEVFIEASELKSGTLREVVEANKYLNLPRLTSQKVFEALCPDERYRSLRKLCIILFTKRGSGEGEKASLCAMAKEGLFPANRVHFTYIYKDVQTKMVAAMRDGVKLVQYKNKTALKLAILWNSGNGEARYTWFPGGWHVSDRTSSATPTQKLKDLIDSVINGSGKLQYTTHLPGLYNEDAPSPMSRIVGRLQDVVGYVVDFLARRDAASIVTMGLGLVVIIALSIFLPQPGDLDKKKRPKPDPSDSHSVDPFNNEALGFIELNRYTEQTLLRESPRGQLTVAILLDAVTTEDAVRSSLLLAFDDVVSNTRGKYKLLFKFVWVSIPDNLEWCTEVMEVHKFGEVIPGTVLAMNGHRKYVMIFKPSDLTRTQYFKSQDGELMGFDDSDDSETDSCQGDGDEWTAYERKRQKVLSISLRKELPRWLEKLTEGLIKKQKLTEWPVMD